MDEWTQRRRQKLLTGLSVSEKLGLEIGALDKPIIKRTDGDVIYVDHADTPALRAKYGHDSNVASESIVDVDAVWGKNTLYEAVQRKVDYIIASHVIEHVPDLITWLTELNQILNDNGTVRLAVPDRRFTFDVLRHETVLSEILHAHLLKPRAPMPVAIFDYILNTRKVNSAEAWDGKIDLASLKGPRTVNESISLAESILKSGEYHDVHCWVFTPRSFATLFEQMATAGLINFACEHFFDTIEHELEFFVIMRKCDDRQELIESWKRMANAAADHITGTPLDKALRELEHTKLELDSAKQRLHNLETSTSWKVTQPLRSVMGALRS
ncbi:MAG TPA: methyltransferase domain-containing protein [Candidatus Obscuribacterales bacterium]